MQIDSLNALSQASAIVVSCLVSPLVSRWKKIYEYSTTWTYELPINVCSHYDFHLIMPRVEVEKDLRSVRIREVARSAQKS